MNTHRPMARITRNNPIGRRKLLRGWFRREKIRRLGIDIGLRIILHRNEAEDRRRYPPLASHPEESLYTLRKHLNKTSLREGRFLHRPLHQSGFIYLQQKQLTHLMFPPAPAPARGRNREYLLRRAPTPGFPHERQVHRPMFHLH